MPRNMDLKGLLKARQEVAEFNIKVQIIEPGSIKTNFRANVRWTEESDAYKTVPWASASLDCRTRRRE